MDYNAHSTSFGPVSNNRGKILDLFIAKYGLDIEIVATLLPSMEGDALPL